MVLGDAIVQPTPAQLDQMKSLVREAMQDGAVGLSTSLQYAPAPYAKTEELIALASEASNSAASTPLTCAAKATPSCLRSTRLCASAAKRIFRSRSGI